MLSCDHVAQPMLLHQLKSPPSHEEKMNEMNFILYCGLRASLRSSLLAVSIYTIVIFVVVLLVGSEKLVKMGCCFLSFLV